MEHIEAESLKSYDAAKVSTHRSCRCPGSEPGKIKIDSDEHLSGCRFWKRIHSSAYGTKQSVVSEISDGVRLGIAIGDECL